MTNKLTLTRQLDPSTPLSQCVKDKDGICYNCKYYLHLVALGQGIRCRHDVYQQIGEKPPLLPSRYHYCEHFSLKDNSST